MKKRFLLFLLCFVFLTACGKTETDHHHHSKDHDKIAEESLQPLKAEFLTESNAFQPNVEGTLKVKVTKGDENVSDASEVQFEIWKKGKQKEAKTFEAKNEGEGVYSLKHTFNEKGIYLVTVHVTARDSHTMPTQEFNVGGEK